MEDLRLSEATELGHAFVQHLANEARIRVLLIKGPGLARHGLRDFRTSADVDVLVEPERYDDFTRLLGRTGWMMRESTLWNTQIATHAKSYWRPEWPCDIDVHNRFPGFLAPAPATFDELWARRTTMKFAQVECEVPDRSSSALILALHSLRGSTNQQRHSAELAQLIRRVSSDPADLAELGRIAESTACISPLRQFLESVGTDLSGLTDTASEQSKREWQAFARGAESSMYVWFHAVRNAHGWQRLSIGSRALWPSSRDLSVGSEFHPTGMSLVGVRLRRLLRGVTAATTAASAGVRRLRTRHRPSQRRRTRPRNTRLI